MGFALLTLPAHAAVRRPGHSRRWRRPALVLLLTCLLATEAAAMIYRPSVGRFKDGFVLWHEGQFYLYSMYMHEPGDDSNFRNAWLIKRACRPTWLSPISPSISAFGTRAATESITIISMAPERIRFSAISSACSPLSGWEIRRFSQSTPSDSA